MPIPEKAQSMHRAAVVSVLPAHNNAWLAFVGTNQDLDKILPPLLSPLAPYKSLNSLFLSLNFTSLFSAHFYNL